MLVKKIFFALASISFVIVIFLCTLFSTELTVGINDKIINGDLKGLSALTKSLTITKVPVGSSSSSHPIPPTTESALYISSGQDSLQRIKLSWTSVFGKGEKDSYHFFSAYYDDRNGAPYAPAVVVLGYAYNEVKRIPLYCVFKYAGRDNVCLKRPLVKTHPSSCANTNRNGDSYRYICPMKAGDDPPLSVMISSVSTCNPNFTSNEIPVGNRDSSKRKTPKKFGVCLGGAVVENENSLQDLVEFISMSKLMGAELITFYISREQLDESIVQYILHRYSDVRVIEWKYFEMWSPLHYYGQFLIISDCMYRSMYETEYLAQIDLDEMIIPIKANSWSEMLQDMPQRERYASLMFENVVFSAKNLNSTDVIPDCSNFKVAKYFTRTDRHLCHYGYRIKTKLMTRPRFALNAGMHNLCSAIGGYGRHLQVPNAVAIAAHYRVSIPYNCKDMPTTIDKSSIKYSDGLNTMMCSKP